MASASGNGSGLRLSGGMLVAILGLAINIGAIVWGAATLAERLSSVNATLVEFRTETKAALRDVGVQLRDHDVRVTRLEETVRPAVRR